jgi:hypothetical protein
LLEARLNQEIKEINFEVISFGMSGFNTAQEYLAYLKHGRKFSPNLVILMFTLGNDISGNSSEIFYSKTKPFFNLVDGKLTQTHFPKSIQRNFVKKILFDYLESPRFIYNKAKVNPLFIWLFNLRSAIFPAEAKVVTADDEEIYLYLENPPGVWQRAWKITAALIKSLNQAVLKDGSQLLVVTIPTSGQVFPDSVAQALKQAGKADLKFDVLKPNKKFEQLANENNFYFLPLLEYLKPLGSKISGPDGHFSYKAHEVVADVLFDFIKENYVISATTTNSNY